MNNLIYSYYNEASQLLFRSDELQSVWGDILTTIVRFNLFYENEEFCHLSIMIIETLLKFSPFKCIPFFNITIMNDIVLYWTYLILVHVIIIHKK